MSVQTNTRKRKASIVERALRIFASKATRSPFHPLNWKRFYEFVGLAHRYKVRWSVGDVARRLKGFGVPADAAREFAEAYWYGRCALYLRRPRGRNVLHSRWLRSDATALN